MSKVLTDEMIQMVVNFWTKELERQRIKREEIRSSAPAYKLREITKENVELFKKLLHEDIKETYENEGKFSIHCEYDGDETLEYVCNKAGIHYEDTMFGFKVGTYFNEFGLYIDGEFVEV